MTSAWIPYDPDDKEVNPLPDNGVHVWIHDAYYEGVTIGMRDGNSRNGWWLNASGSDDVGVTHWMPLEVPPAPSLEPDGGFVEGDVYVLGERSERDRICSFIPYPCTCGERKDSPVHYDPDGGHHYVSAETFERPSGPPCATCNGTTWDPVSKGVIPDPCPECQTIARIAARLDPPKRCTAWIFDYTCTLTEGHDGQHASEEGTVSWSFEDESGTCTAPVECSSFEGDWTEECGEGLPCRYHPE